MRRMLPVLLLAAAGCNSPTEPSYYPAFDVLVCKERECVFRATTAQTADLYSWDFGDRTRLTSPEFTARHTYPFNGVYKVTLAVGSEKFVREVLVFPDL